MSKRFGIIWIVALFYLLSIAPKVISETVLDAGSFVCGIQADNTLACWGKSGNMPPSGTFFQINTSGRQKCAIRTDNTLICWKGNGKEVVSPDKLFSQVSSGDHHACGVLTDNSVVCWGDNEHGQATPPQGDFIQVSVGDEFSCGIRFDNTLACWGRYSEGNKPFPWEHPSGTFSQISASPYHICGIYTDGRPVCWGAAGGVFEQNYYDPWVVPGRLSDGKDIPPENGTFYQVSGGRAWFTCWLRMDRAVLCSGTIEFPSTEVIRPPHSTCTCQPIRPDCVCESSDKLFTQITAGSNYACGIRFDNTVLCWGENLNGELFPPAGLVLKSSDPTACLIYGIHDDDNTTQFFIINSGSSELYPRSQLETHLDIQALDSHPVTNQLYAASGHNTDNPGYLYEVRNGAQDILEVGESGFESIEALAFHPDGTLWGWSQEAG
ncbi:MAG: RCC1 domain-containing protein, partial [Pseudomonadota bacterium]|nr:RCC1 domain-containing protein [Pseudomonadota bacterium]